MKNINYQGNIEMIERDIAQKTEKYWFKYSQKRVMQLFFQMAERVPAYKDFLLKNRIDPNKIKTIDDLKLVPPINKNNYLRYYPLELLCW